MQKPGVANRGVISGLLVALLFAGTAPALTADEIVGRLDRNSAARTMSYSAKLTISLGGEVRTKEFTGWARGADSAYIEFTAPARDRGTRFLKLGGEMWMWLKEVGKSTKLAGHMLRQSFAGSDFSYSDAARNSKLLDDYTAERTGLDTTGGVTLVVVELTARRPDVDYARQVLRVDTTDFVARSSDFYAASGKLLKSMELLGFRPTGGRNYPTRVRLTNRLRNDTWTEMEFIDVKLDVPVPSDVFTRGYLEK